MEIDKIKTAFKERYHAEPIIVRSPGRINIIGEHTDYNGGLVLPAAIDKAIYVAVAGRNDDEIHLYAEDFKQAHLANINVLEKSEKGWPDYILGVVDQLMKRGFAIGGFNLYIDGDVPFGAGLSSSAAVECAVGFALSSLFQLNIDKMDLAFIAQKAEHTFAGVNCGIMDQFASVFGKKNEAIMLDCRSMEYTYVPLQLEGYKLVLLNTNVKHTLAESAYNKRRAQCEQGVSWVKEKFPQVKTLRDVTLTQLEDIVLPKDRDTYIKCKFIIEEYFRVLSAVDNLKNGNLKALGDLLYAAHEGLSKSYEVSCKELDFLVDATVEETDITGARMMGGGFGGCTINIVKNESVDRIVKEISKKYCAAFGFEPTAYIVETGAGTALIN